MVNVRVGVWGQSRLWPYWPRMERLSLSASLPSFGSSPALDDDSVLEGEPGHVQEFGRGYSLLRSSFPQHLGDLGSLEDLRIHQRRRAGFRFGIWIGTGHQESAYGGW